MRSVSSTTQQTLSAEAASVLKHSLTLARRRGHAQVTPLHVAGTLLTSRTSLLRTACLKSQQQPQNHHPLQCRALELCFNVALNRLPATPGPLLHAQPSLSNALVAALKRAQAHQRRGCVEQQNHQQQQIMGVKVELDQLVLSILDDPSVSRVMREAGFSSTKVKECLEECNSYGVSSVFYNASGGIYSTPSSPPSETANSRVIYGNSPYCSYGYNKEDLNMNSLWGGSNSAGLFHNPLVFSPEKRVFSNYTSTHDYSCIKEDDVKLVVEVFLRKKRRNTVVIGDSVSLAEGLVSEVMKKVERDAAIHADLRSAHIIKFQFSSVPLTFMKREEVEMNVGDLKRKIDAFTSDGRSVIVYTGDLRWTVDDRKSSPADDDNVNQSGGLMVYNPVDHLVAEMGKLISWYNSCSAKVWLMATASYQTYMKCQMKQPPLDVQWNLQAVSVPISGGLGLSLDAAPSIHDSRTNLSRVLDKRPCNVKEEQDKFLTCCQECTSNYEKEASFKLQSVHKDSDNGPSQLPSWLKPHGTETSEKQDDLAQLRRKYNNLCQSLHQRRHSPIRGEKSSFSVSYPHWPRKNNIFADTETISFAYPAEKFNRNPISVPRFRRQQSCHIEFSFCNEGLKHHQSLEPNLDSLKVIDDKEVKITLALGSSSFSDPSKNERHSMDLALCDSLQENVPWQFETIPLIAGALVDHKTIDQDKLLLIEGNDVIGIRRITVGTAKSMFGSSDSHFRMNMRENTNTAKESCEMLESALKTHEKLVVLIEDADYADPEFVRYLIDGFEDGKLRTSTRGEKDRSCSVIFVLTVYGGTGLHEANGNDLDSVIAMKLVVEESKQLGSAMMIPTNLNNKRKAEWDFSVKSKSPRNHETEEVSSSEITRQSSLDLNALDLNIKADEGEHKPQEPTRVLLEKIKKRFTLNADSNQEERAKEMFSLKLRRAFHEANRSLSFNIDEGVLEEIYKGSGLYLNSLFEQWVKDVFETSLRMVNSGGEGGKEKVSIRLCLGGKREKCGLGQGYRNTSLPKKIQVSKLDMI